MGRNPLNPQFLLFRRHANPGAAMGFNMIRQMGNALAAFGFLAARTEHTFGRLRPVVDGFFHVVVGYSAANTNIHVIKTSYSKAMVPGRLDQLTDLGLC